MNTNLFFRLISLSFVALTLNASALASYVSNSDFEEAQKRTRKQFSDNVLNRAHLKNAAAIAQTEGRELHIILGAAPFESHMQELFKREQQQERDDASKTFRAPLRIFFTDDSRCAPEASTPWTPIYFGNFNEFSCWDDLVSQLSGKEKKSNESLSMGPVDKIYFDWSTVKFVKWQGIILHRMSFLLKSTGALYLPEVNMASQCTFADSEVTSVEYDALKKEGNELSRAIIDSLPYGKALAPSVGQRSQDKTLYREFLVGFSMMGVEQRGSKLYVYNSKHLLFDTNFKGPFKFTPGQKQPYLLKFESFGGDKGYPHIGSQYGERARAGAEIDFSVKNYVKVTLALLRAE